MAYLSRKSSGKHNSPMYKFLRNPVAVTDEALQECVTKGLFSPLALELYEEAATVLAVCSHLYVTSSPEESALPRNQAVCAGLLVRITKFMAAVASLVSQKSDCADVVFALNRSITESATNLHFLVLKSEDRFFDQFVSFSLSSERELYDVIKKNITERGGETLPIEQRMLNSIDRVCQLSGVAISDVQPKMHNWGGGLRNRMIAIGKGDAYAMQQRIPSHAVHGTWVDLALHHLTEAENMSFRPDLTSSRVDSRLMLPICILVLAAACTYVEAFFSQLPEAEPLFERITDLTQRIMTVDEAHEESINSRKLDDE